MPSNPPVTFDIGQNAPPLRGELRTADDRKTLVLKVGGVHILYLSADGLTPVKWIGDIGLAQEREGSSIKILPPSHLKALDG